MIDLQLKVSCATWSAVAIFLSKFQMRSWLPLTSSIHSSQNYSPSIWQTGSQTASKYLPRMLLVLQVQLLASLSPKRLLMVMGKLNYWSMAALLQIVQHCLPTCQQSISWMNKIQEFLVWALVHHSHPNMTLMDGTPWTTKYSPLILWSMSTLTWLTINSSKCSKDMPKLSKQAKVKTTKIIWELNASQTWQWIRQPRTILMVLLTKARNSIKIKLSLSRPWLSKLLTKSSATYSHGLEI